MESFRGLVGGIRDTTKRGDVDGNELHSAEFTIETFGPFPLKEELKRWLDSGKCVRVVLEDMPKRFQSSRKGR